MRVRTIINFLIIRAFEALVILLLIIFMPNVPPNCKIWDPYTVAPTKPLEGKLALNDRLHTVEIWHKGDLTGPEAFANYNGELYASLVTGEIAKLHGNHITPVVKFGKPCKGFYQERICGRPLGLQFDKDGSLVAADAYYGIFRVDVKTGENVQIISTDVEIEGKKPQLINSVAIASNGDIYWTDSSTEFALEDGMLDLLADGSGRLIHYDVKTKENTVLMDNLHFANGVHLSDDEEFVVVSETARNRLQRYYLKGPKNGTSDIFIDGLPGLPDNINSDGQGGFLVPLIIAIDEDYPFITQIIGPFPFIRKFVARVFGLSEFGFKVLQHIYPTDYAEMAIHYIGHFSSFTFVSPHRVTILHVSKTGEIIDSLHVTNKKIGLIAEAHIFQNVLYLGSPFNDYIARIPLEDAGLSHLLKNKSPESQTLPLTSTPTTKQSPPSTSTEQTPLPTQTPIKTTPEEVIQEHKTQLPTQAPKKIPQPTQAPKTTQPTQAPIKTPQPTQAPIKTPQPTQPAKKTTEQVQIPKTTAPPAIKTSEHTKEPSAKEPDVKNVEQSTVKVTEVPKAKAAVKENLKPTIELKGNTQPPKQTSHSQTTKDQSGHQVKNDK